MAAVGSRIEVARGCWEAGEVALADGRLREADAALRDGLEQIAGEEGDDARLLEGELCDALCRLSLDVGEDLAAEAWLARARALREGAEGRLSPSAGRSWLLEARLRVLADRDPAAGAACCERARRLLRGRPEEQEALALLGHCQRELGDLDAAAETLEAALEHDVGAQTGEQTGELGRTLELLTELARTRAAQGQHEAALSVVHRRVALVHARLGPGSREALDSLLLLAALSEGAGDLESAAGALQRAVELLEGEAEAGEGATDEALMARAYLLGLQSRIAGVELPGEE